MTAQISKIHQPFNSSRNNPPKLTTLIKYTFEMSSPAINIANHLLRFQILRIRVYIPNTLSSIKMYTTKHDKL